MAGEEIKELITKGEKIDVEFKESKEKLNKDVYESVCAFNNRDGGHLILGVVDKTREICGVNPEEADKMIKDFTTSINNANKINPPLYLTPEPVEIDDKKVIYIRVPEGTQLRRLNGRIFDRSHEGDIDITDNAELVYKMYARKQSTYFVNKVYPNLSLDCLDYSVIQKAKRLAVSRVDNHAWTDMSEEEILRSSGLILTDPDTGKEGITLAAILLFGKDSSIMSVLPQYKTDAIFRVKNVDRYDDREVVITNLVDSYRRLMDFGKKHLNDVFVMEGDQSISARDKILREIISNILAHRDYSNAYAAQFVIEKDRVYTKNSNLPHGHGGLQLNKFEPFPKNPAISKVFREIGYADELGSGMRNTNKYTKMYSGGTPVFTEDNIFEIVIPVSGVADLTVGPSETDKETNKETNKEIADKIIDIMKETPEISVKEIADILNISVGGVRYHINKMKNSGIIEHQGATKKGMWVVK